VSLRLRSEWLSLQGCGSVLSDDRLLGPVPLVAKEAQADDVPWNKGGQRFLQTGV
jgi:hypothetical protein